MTDDALEQYENDQDDFLRRLRKIEVTNRDHEREAMAAIGDLAACHKYLTMFAKCLVLSVGTATALALAIVLLVVFHIQHVH